MNSSKNSILKLILITNKIAKESDIIFLCCLPFQGDIVLREIRGILNDRNFEASKDKTLNKPMVISTLAAIGVPKLKILASQDTILLRTSVNVLYSILFFLFIFIKKIF